MFLRTNEVISQKQNHGREPTNKIRYMLYIMMNFQDNEQYMMKIVNQTWNWVTSKGTHQHVVLHVYMSKNARTFGFM